MARERWGRVERGRVGDRCRDGVARGRGRMGKGAEREIIGVPENENFTNAPLPDTDHQHGHI